VYLVADGEQVLRVREQEGSRSGSWLLRQASLRRRSRDRGRQHSWLQGQLGGYIRAGGVASHYPR
jgi:hypothetical protein